jgi:hypothetical protein
LTKVLATLIEAEWEVDWPGALADRGRGALEAVLAKLEEADEAWRFSAEDLAPLEEITEALAEEEKCVSAGGFVADLENPVPRSRPGRERLAGSMEER